MKVNKQTILLVIIAILGGYTIFQNQGIKTDVAGYNAKIESIQKEIDSVQIENNKIYIGTNSENVHFYYTVFAERKDVDKLIVEYLKKD